MKSAKDIAADAILEAFGVDEKSDPNAFASWKKHCDRYHPEGFKEGSSCKYIRGENSKRLETSKEKKDISFTNYGKLLEEKFFVRPIRFKKREHLADEIIDEKVINAIVDYTLPTDDQDYQETLEASYNVLKDLKESFPQFSMPHNFLIPARMNMKVKYGGALSSVDRSATYDAYIVISKNDRIPFTGICYGHNDERYFSDRLRHEIGHVLSTPEVLKKFIELTSEYRRTLGDDVFYQGIRTIVSVGAIEDMFEGVAEIFSFITSPEYKKGILPKPFENFVEKDMMHLKGGENGNL